MKFDESHFCCNVGRIGPTLEVMVVLRMLPLYEQKNAMGLTLARMILES